MNNQVPDPTMKNYCAYNNVKFHYSDELFQGSFVPYVSVS